MLVLNIITSMIRLHTTDGSDPLDICGSGAATVYRLIKVFPEPRLEFEGYLTHSFVAIALYCMILGDGEIRKFPHPHQSKRHGCDCVVVRCILEVLLVVAPEQANLLGIFIVSHLGNFALKRGDVVN